MIKNSTVVGLGLNIKLGFSGNHKIKRWALRNVSLTVARKPASQPADQSARLNTEQSVNKRVEMKAK